MLFLGHFLLDRLGLFLGLCGAIALLLAVLFKNENRILGDLKARIIKGNDPWNIIITVKKYVKILDLPDPQIYIIDNNTPLAFTIGHPWKKSIICISTGLHKRLTPSEFEAVIAHQVCRTQQVDNFGFMVSHVLAYAIVSVADFFDTIPTIRNFQPFIKIMSPLAWGILKFSVKDKVFYENDDLTISIIHDRRTLAEALWKLDHIANCEPIPIAPCSSHFFFVNPEGKNKKNWFLLTHPKIENRIKRLVGYFPI